ncbi:hypothetical protein F0562_034433 [Nyssa sinensis]|uniref:Uncharacterized protein n=1 Tax=Nyssa sinensis TaxID=561372 RepID=A0A5J5AG42_9ASTE|nr:hypothetical protein F0562_034433 [Nyssa sinensis]
MIVFLYRGNNVVLWLRETGIADSRAHFCQNRRSDSWGEILGATLGGVRQWLPALHCDDEDLASLFLSALDSIFFPAIPSSSPRLYTPDRRSISAGCQML